MRYVNLYNVEEIYIGDEYPREVHRVYMRYVDGHLWTPKEGTLEECEQFMEWLMVGTGQPWCKVD